jgi:hypothetical protein
MPAVALVGDDPNKDFKKGEGFTPLDRPCWGFDFMP